MSLERRGTGTGSGWVASSFGCGFVPLRGIIDEIWFGAGGVLLNLKISAYLGVSVEKSTESVRRGSGQDAVGRMRVSTESYLSFFSSLTARADIACIKPHNADAQLRITSDCVSC